MNNKLVNYGLCGWVSLDYWTYKCFKEAIKDGKISISRRKGWKGQPLEQKVVTSANASQDGSEQDGSEQDGNEQDGDYDEYGEDYENYIEN